MKFGKFEFGKRGESSASKTERLEKIAPLREEIISTGKELDSIFDGVLSRINEISRNLTTVETADERHALMSRALEVADAQYEQIDKLIKFLQVKITELERLKADGIESIRARVSGFERDKAKVSEVRNRFRKIVGESLRKRFEEPTSQ